MFKSVGQNITSWWGGGTATDNKDDDKQADAATDEKTQDTKTETQNENVEQSAASSEDQSKEGTGQGASSEKTEDAQAAVMNAAKEWGSYLFNVTKAASKTVSKTAKQLKNKVEEAHILDQTILGDFSKEQEKFMHEKKEEQKRSEAAVPPWVGYNEEEAMKGPILALSSDKRNFLRNPPSGAQFQFDFVAMQPVAKATLEEDPELEKMRFELVPKQVKEENFWRNYFYRVSLIKQSTQLTSLAEQTGTTGESAANKKDAGATDQKSKAPEPVIQVTQPTPEQEEFPPESPSHDAEFVSDHFQDGGMSEEELRNEMHQLGMDEKTAEAKDGIDGEDNDDNIPEWEKELQAELNEYEVIVDELDDADLESQILQEIEQAAK